MSATRSVCGTVAANLVIGRHHVDVRQVLQRAHLVLAQRALAADQQHRALRAQGVGHAGDGVGGARAGGDDGAAGLAGDARVAVGGVRGDLLVADVDDVDALVDAAVVDVDDVAAAEREDHVDALGLERLGDEMPAGDEFRGVGVPARVTWSCPASTPYVQGPFPDVVPGQSLVVPPN